MCDYLGRIYSFLKRIFTPTIIFILITFVVVGILLFLIPHTVIPVLSSQFYQIKQSEYNIPELYFYALTAIGTITLAIVAYQKIKGLIDKNETQILLEIDKRWGERGIMKARYIIHGIYRECMDSLECNNDIQKLNVRYPDYLQINNIKDISDNYMKALKDEDRASIMPFVSFKIMTLSIASREIKNNRNQKDFMYLLELLEFMDFIGFLVKTDQVSLDKVKGIFGNSIIFNYEVFKNYIELKNAKHPPEKYFENFTILYNKIKLSD
jgi:hypothetical protein